MSSRRPDSDPGDDWAWSVAEPGRGRRSTGDRPGFGATGVLATVVAALAVVVASLGAVVYLHERDARSEDAMPVAASRAPVTAPPTSSVVTAPETVTRTVAVPEAAGGGASSSSGSSSSSGESSSGSDPDSGDYDGGLVQSATTTLPQREYEATMSLWSGGGSIDYPTLGCHGVLTSEGHDDDTVLLRERITSGDCDQGGLWRVTRTDSYTIRVGYTPVSGRYVVGGTLTR